METRSMKRRKLLMIINNIHDITDDMDRISDLPEVILHRILSLLPINNIAQCSVLSKRWRSIWLTFPDLDFTTIDPAIPITSMKFINDVLCQREKIFGVRLLRFRAYNLSFSHLNTMIRRAIRLNVQELDIEVSTGDFFNLPRCIITSGSLRICKLKSYQGFRLPPTMIMNSGFQSLQALSLSVLNSYHQPSLVDLFTDSSFPNLKILSLEACNGLENLRVSCLEISDLTIENCHDIRSLDVCGLKMLNLRVSNCFHVYRRESCVKINTPKLQKLVWELNSISAKSCLKKMNCLTEASVGFRTHRKDHYSHDTLASISNLLGNLSIVHSLILTNECVQILSGTGILLRPFNNLKTLELNSDFKTNKHAGLACIFKNCPSVQTLILKLVVAPKTSEVTTLEFWEEGTNTEEQFWESQIKHLDLFLQNLNVVKIYGFLGTENEISLAKFLLKHGKALQYMNIYSGKYNYRNSVKRQKIRSQMISFSSVFSKAKFNFR